MRVGLDTVHGKIVASAAILGIAAAVAGLGTFGTFTSATTATSTAVSSGTVALAVGASGAANRLSVAASNIVPGDTIQRAVDLTNTGNTNLVSVTAAVTASGANVLSTDTTNGLQIQIDRCAGGAWVEANSPTYTYTCAGGSSSVFSALPVVQAAAAMAGLASLTAGSTDHLVVTISLPVTAGNTFQTLSSNVGITFNGIQRVATHE